MNKPTEQPKMYRLINDEAWEDEEIRPQINIPYAADFVISHNNPHATIEYYAKVFPQDWELVQPEQTKNSMKSEAIQQDADFISRRISDHANNITILEFRKQYWAKDGAFYIGCDNRTGDCFVENFSTKDELFAWLNGEQEPEPEPFTPTHEVTEGCYKNERVIVVQQNVGEDGEHLVQNSEGDTWQTFSDYLTPIEIPKTTLTEQQHENLVEAFYKNAQIFDWRAKEIIREWADQNNVELP